MFDDNTFSRSKTYFTTQQLCRIFGACIDETINDLQDHYGESQYFWERIAADSRQKSPHASTTAMPTNVDIFGRMVSKFEEIITQSENKLQALRHRFDAEEVESLRDAVSTPSYILLNFY